MALTLHTDFVTRDVYVFIMIFVRIGTMCMVMPGFDSHSIPAQVRLFLALAVSFLLTPVLMDSFPALPASMISLSLLVLGELMVGLAIGLIARIFFSAIQVAGTFIAFQSGLAFAQTFDPTQDSQGVITGSFLSVMALTLLFVTDLHHLLLAAMRDSYTLFAPGTPLPVGDFTQSAVQALSKAFAVGIQIATPVAAAGFTLYVATGVLAKLIPQVQIFFVIMPANILLGFIVMFLVLSTMMTWFLDNFQQHLSQFLG